jgi:hypothetical protein
MHTILYTDGKTGYRYCDTFQKKEDGLMCVLQFLQLAKRQRKIPTRFLQLDGGFELAGANGEELKVFVKSEGIHLIVSDPYIPEKNGVAERANRIIIEKARIWMIAAKADHRLWPYFFDTALKLHTEQQNQSPQQDSVGSVHGCQRPRKTTPGRFFKPPHTWLSCLCTHPKSATTARCQT